MQAVNKTTEQQGTAPRASRKIASSAEFREFVALQNNFDFWLLLTRREDGCQLTSTRNRAVKVTTQRGSTLTRLTNR